MDKDAIDQETGKLKRCRDICDALSDCQCIHGTEDRRRDRDGNALDFITNPSWIDSAILSVLTDQNELRSLRITMFDARITRKSHVQSLYLVSHRMISNLLSNAVHKVHERKIVMKIPKTEADDARLEMKAIPLILDDSSKKQKFTKSCTLKPRATKCAVIVDTAYDYNVEVSNHGLMADNIELYFKDIRNDTMLREVLSGGDSNGSTSSSHFGRYRYGIVSMFVFIMVLILGFIIKNIKLFSETI